MKIEAPCRRDCPSRSGTCHATCPEYLEYEKRKKEEQQIKMKECHRREDLEMFYKRSRARKYGARYRTRKE